MKHSQYSKLTAKQIEEYLKDLTYKADKKFKLNIWAFGTIDDEGNIKCGFLEEFDKAMKEEVNKRYGKSKEGIEEESEGS